MSENIQLFITCLVDTFYPETGQAVVEVFKRLGMGVDFPPGQTCCGQPMFNAGMRSEAVPLAQHTITVFENARGPLVIPSGSCAAMIRHGYPELFADNPAWLRRAQALAKRTFELTEYLVDVLGITDLEAHWPGRLTYHPSCHLLRGLGVDRQPRLLLAAVRGAEILELPQADECCGFGGVFSVEHPEISAEMLKRKIGNLEASTSPTLVVCDTGCRMHLAGGLHRLRKSQQVVHIAEVLARREADQR